MSTRTPNFPEHPEDGFVVKEYLDDGRVLVWTYNKALNQWAAHFVYPEEAATEGWVLGQGYVQGPVRTRDVLTTDPLAKGESILKTQEQVNNLIAEVAETAVRTTGRTTDQVDFLQNSIGKGTWNHVFTGVGIPKEGEFWTQSNEVDFAAITLIVVNDVAVDSGDTTTNPGTLRDTRVGDYLTIQERGTNDFGMYVVEQAAVQVVDDQTIREFSLKLFANRAKGSTIVNASRCQITTSRPVYTVVQDDEPKVSTRGVLWYRESDDVLSISNYGTGEVGVNGAQWTEINGGPEANPDDYLKLSGGTITGPTTFDCPTMVKWDEASSNSYPFSVYGGDKWAFRVGWDGVVKSFGEFIIDQPSGTALRIKKDHVDKVKIEHSGKIFCNYNMSLDDDPTTVPNKGWVKEQIEAIPEPEGSGGSFIDKYDGNRFVRGGDVATDLNNGDVLFLNASYKSTDDPTEIAYISLPKDEFDWHAFTNSGNIKVKAGSKTAGYFYAYAFMHQASAQVLVSVFPLQAYAASKLEAESGAPCYFHGLFFK